MELYKNYIEWVLNFYNIIYLYFFDNNENKKIKNANKNESIFYANKKNIENETNI